MKEEKFTLKQLLIGSIISIGVIVTLKGIGIIILVFAAVAVGMLLANGEL